MPENFNFNTFCYELEVSGQRQRSMVVLHMKQELFIWEMAAN